MKKLIFINGAMGVGKTTTSQILKNILPRTVFLDGDWCWDMSPFVVTEETKDMVVDNICHLLNNFIHCTEYENIIFCWVMHEQSIIDDILAKLDRKKCEYHIFTLMCTEAALIQRLEQDLKAGRREPDVISRAFERLKCYARMNTNKIEVSDISAEQAAALIAEQLGEDEGAKTRICHEDKLKINYRIAALKDLKEIHTMVQRAIETMNNQQIYQWDELYPDEEILREDIEKQQLYVGLVEETIAVIYVLNQECDEEYQTGKWKYAQKPFYVIHRLCVNPVFQNQGVAGRTMLHIEETLRVMGIAAIRLDVFSENPSALKLYDNFGFAKVGYVDWRKGRFYLMEKYFE